MEKVLLKPNIKKGFIGVVGMLFIFSMWEMFSKEVTLNNMLLHNTLIFVVLIGFLYQIYIRQEYIYGSQEKIIKELTKESK